MAIPVKRCLFCFAVMPWVGTLSILNQVPIHGVHSVRFVEKHTWIGIFWMKYSWDAIHTNRDVSIQTYKRSKHFHPSTPFRCIRFKQIFNDFVMINDLISRQPANIDQPSIGYPQIFSLLFFIRIFFRRLCKLHNDFEECKLCVIC